MRDTSTSAGSVAFSTRVDRWLVAVLGGGALLSVAAVIGSLAFAVVILPP